VAVELAGISNENRLCADRHYARKNVLEYFIDFYPLFKYKNKNI
jgi:hypothetical protein